MACVSFPFIFNVIRSASFSSHISSVHVFLSAFRVDYTSVDDAANFICGTFGKTEPEVKLSCCSACKSAWFCSQECLKQAWKGGHKKICGSRHHSLKKFPSSNKDNIEAEIDSVGSCVVFFHGPNDLFVFCRDHEKGGIFEALTD